MQNTSTTIVNKQHLARLVHWFTQPDHVARAREGDPVVQAELRELIEPLTDKQRAAYDKALRRQLGDARVERLIDELQGLR